MALEEIQDTTSIMDPEAVKGYDAEIVSYHRSLKGCLNHEKQS